MAPHASGRSLSPAVLRVSDPAAFAAQEFARRKAAAARKLAAGEWDAPRAEAMLRPWLAIACAVKANLPECFETNTVIYPFGQSGRERRRRLWPADICPPSEYTLALFRAREAAIERAESEPTPHRLAHARGLIALADCLQIAPVDFPALDRRAQATAGGSATRNAA